MTESGKNPFESPPPDPPKRRQSAAGESIENEPQFSFEEFREDESERTAAAGLDPIGGPQTLDDEVEHSVWDEPGLSSRLAGLVPESATRYDAWLTKGQAEFSPSKSAMVWWSVVLLAGPWAIVGTFVTQLGGMGSGGLLAVCLFGPLIEEIMKVAAILWIVEKRPYLFRSKPQIITAAMASGLWFAVIENGLYLNVYIQDPSLEIIIWRWTVCVLLHVGCTLVSGVGLSRVWEHTMSTRTRPKMSLAANWLIGAVVCHALYNSSAVLVSAAKELVLTTDHARIVGKATKTAQIDFRSTSEAYNVTGLRGHVGPFPWHVGPFPWAGEIWNGQINVKWRYDGMAITLTERAATEVQRIIGEQKLEDGTLLRVGVSGGGCSGFSYALGFDKEYDEKADSRSTQHGVDVIVDRKSALYLDGTTVDFYDGLEKRGFTFDNPNAVKSCGCGSSFQA